MAVIEKESELLDQHRKMAVTHFNTKRQKTTASFTSTRLDPDMKIEESKGSPR